ncbi:hypothetical protein HHI36_005161, partial [Cryptolaemus montrouzieri]
MYQPQKNKRCNPLPVDVQKLRGESLIKLIMEAGALCLTMEENDACIIRVDKNID